jgi:hypothetical protein
MLSAVLFVGATVAQSQLPTLGLPAMPWLEQRQGHQCMACFAAGTDPAYVQLMQTVYGGTSLAAGLEDYRTLDRWAAPTGSGRVLTYSFPPDGLAISGHGGNVLRQLSLAKWGNEQAWKDWFRGVFDSWQAVTDLRFVEVLDDGAAWGTLGSGFVRGDIRLGAGTIDGMGNTLALARLPSGGGDIVIDRVDMPGMDLTCFASLVAHEIGHTLGLVHVCPLDSSKLMEPMLNCLSGPSVDDIRGGQDLYGDRFEPNETASAAVSLTSRGARPGVTLRLFNLGLRTDSDQDWFSLELCPQDQVTVTVMPIGSNYPEGPQTQQGCTATGTVQASSLLDLALEFAPPGGFPSLINANGLGGNETHNVSGAGRINFRVFAWTSRSQRNQLYDLIVDIQPRPSSSVLYVNAAATSTRAAGSTRRWPRRPAAAAALRRSGSLPARTDRPAVSSATHRPTSRSRSWSPMAFGCSAVSLAPRQNWPSAIRSPIGRSCPAAIHIRSSAASGLATSSR